MACSDVSTCVQCLRLHGQTISKDLITHEGCRCVRLDISDYIPGDWSKNDHATMFGPLQGESLKFYVAYLLERAILLEARYTGADLSKGLWKALAELQNRFPLVPVGLQAGVAAHVLSQDPDPKLETAVEILQCVAWPGGNLRPVYQVLVNHEKYAELEAGLERLAQSVSDMGEYTGRHQGMLYRDAAQITKKFSKNKTAEYLGHAARLNPDNTAILVEFGGMLRQLGRTQEALDVLMKALHINPSLKGAQKELAKLEATPVST